MKTATTVNSEMESSPETVYRAAPPVVRKGTESHRRSGPNLSSGQPFQATFPFCNLGLRAVTLLRPGFFVVSFSMRLIAFFCASGIVCM
jgi:hypothetical protein